MACCEGSSSAHPHPQASDSTWAAGWATPRERAPLSDLPVGCFLCGVRLGQVTLMTL